VSVSEQTAAMAAGRNGQNAEAMSYTTESGRQQILSDAGAAGADLGVALAAVGEAYDHLDEHLADTMEARVFRPLQSAYAQLGRTLSEFAQRHGLPEPQLPRAVEPAPGDPRRLLEGAADAAVSADETLAELQDSLLPVEVGDQALRAGLSGVRSVIASVPAACDELIRAFGR
jgi:hypothetical protein